MIKRWEWMQKNFQLLQRQKTQPVPDPPGATDKDDVTVMPGPESGPNHRLLHLNQQLMLPSSRLRILVMIQFLV